MFGPLRYLVEVEKHLLRGSHDYVKYRDLIEKDKPPPTYFQPRKRHCKPQKANKLMVLMINTQLHKCVLCGRKLGLGSSLSSHHPDRPSFDHVVSKVKGGLDRNNRIAAHRQCNSLKSDRDPTGCELIWLAVVNRAIEKHSESFLDMRIPKKGNLQ